MKSPKKLHNCKWARNLPIFVYLAFFGILILTTHPVTSLEYERPDTNYDSQGHEFCKIR